MSIVEKERVLRILMLEDSAEDIELIERVLRKNSLSFVAEHVDTRDEFTNAMSHFEPDIVLSDHGLPMFNSMEALKICQREKAVIPFIIVTGTMSDEFAISCLQQGADDYLLKSNLSRLPQAIRRAVKERKLMRLKREARHALRKQNQELLKVNKELDNFVYSVSHNLRGPVASVKGLLNIVENEEEKEKVDRVISMMRSSIDKLDETLKEILDFMRNARAEIQLGEVDWREVIGKSLASLEYLKADGNITVREDLQIDTPFFSDGRRIRAILLNLLSNSFIYRSPNQESCINISVVVSGTHAKITIKDNGIGIAAENLPKVFDMFYRGTAESQGAGLGLYITKEIVRKLKGEIKIESVVTKGTEVTVRIPNEVSCELDI